MLVVLALSRLKVESPFFRVERCLPVMRFELFCTTVRVLSLENSQAVNDGFNAVSRNYAHCRSTLAIHAFLPLRLVFPAATCVGFSAGGHFLQHPNHDIERSGERVEELQLVSITNETCGARDVLVSEFPARSCSRAQLRYRRIADKQKEAD